MFTPLIVVMIAIGTTDLVFALDSIPAIFGLTKEPYIVFTANVFALMGLRQLYFLLGGLLDRLKYLSVGLAIVLGFIGVKLVMEALHANNVPFINGGEPITSVPEIPIWLSLTVIVGTLVGHHGERAWSAPAGTGDGEARAGREAANAAAPKLGQGARPEPARDPAARARSVRTCTRPRARRAARRGRPSCPRVRPGPGRSDGVQHLPAVALGCLGHEPDVVDRRARLGRRSTDRRGAPGRAGSASIAVAWSWASRGRVTPNRRQTRCTRPGAVHAVRRDAAPDVRDVAQPVGPLQDLGVVGSVASAARRPRRSSIAHAGSNRPGTATGSQPSCGAPSAISRVPKVTPGTARAASGSSRSAVAVATTTCHTPVRSSTVAAVAVAGRDPHAGGVDAVQGGELVDRHPARVAARVAASWAGPARPPGPSRR